MEDAYEQARAVWPALEVPRDAFDAFVAGAEGDVVWSDLYLACACSRNVPGSIEAFEVMCAPSIEGALAA